MMASVPHWAKAAALPQWQHVVSSSGSDGGGSNAGSGSSHTSSSSSCGQCQRTLGS
jgi:hypothetical protein